MNKGQAVYIVDGSRTPFIKARGKPNPFKASDLAVEAGKDLLLKTGIDTKLIDEAIIGCVAPRAEEANIARLIACRMGCETSMPAMTVNRNCGSGMQAVDNSVLQIQSGRSDIVIAGGADALSQTPLLFSDEFVVFVSAWGKAKTFSKKLKALSQFKLKSLIPIPALLRGLTDPLVNLNMGETAENLVHEFGLQRQELDEFSLSSHQKLTAAIDNGSLKDVIAIASKTGELYTHDDGVRKTCTIEQLGKLKPFFDKKFGVVTAGNSSQISDGAVMLLIAGEEAVKKYNLTPRAQIIDSYWAGLDPKVMGLGPAYSIPPLLTRNNLTMESIDYWEINEAFAAQVIACVKAMDSKEFCKKELNMDSAIGAIDMNKLNIYGGAISCGHPLGASGTRLLLQLTAALENNDATYGIASQCIGGGQGGAMLIKKV